MNYGHSFFLFSIGSITIKQMLNMLFLPLNCYLKSHLIPIPISNNDVKFLRFNSKAL